MKTIRFADPAYPRLLREVPGAPDILFMLGDLLPEDCPAVAIVGSRRATRWGVETAGRIAGDLARAGVTVVSGLAVGIDAAAHRGALAAGGRTIAVLGSGLDRIWPFQNADLAEEILGMSVEGESRGPPRPTSCRPLRAPGRPPRHPCRAARRDRPLDGRSPPPRPPWRLVGPGRVAAHPALAPAATSSGRRGPPRGALLAEYPPGTPPLPAHFLERNRIVVGLAAAVVVVEAAGRSGALNSASWAADFGREVFVVPNRPGAPNAAGVLRLLAEGARPYVSVDDLLDEVERHGGAPRRGAAGGAPAGRDGDGDGDHGDAAVPGHLAPLHRALAEAGGEADLEEVAAAAGVAYAEAAAGLVELEVLGLVRSAAGSRYALA